MRALVDPASARASSELVLAETMASSDMANTPLRTTRATMMARSGQGKGVTPIALAQSGAEASSAILGKERMVRARLFNQGQSLRCRTGSTCPDLPHSGRHGIDNPELREDSIMTFSTYSAFRHRRCGVAWHQRLRHRPPIPGSQKISRTAIGTGLGGTLGLICWAARIGGDAGRIIGAGVGSNGRSGAGAKTI